MPPSADALAVPLRAVKSLAAKVRTTGLTAKRLLGLTESQLLIVLGFEKDAFLERNWTNRERRELLSDIRLLHPDLAIAWNYSVWYRNATYDFIVPRVEQLENRGRSLRIYADLQLSGITAVPHIYWGKIEDLDEWANWLQQNPVVTHFAVDLQTLNRPGEWKRALRRLEYFRERLQPRSARAIFSGVCKLERLVELKQVWPESSLINYGAHLRSTGLRKKECFGLDRPWHVDPDSWTRQEVFDELVRQFALIFDSDRVGHQVVGARS